MELRSLRILRCNPKVPKASQLHLLHSWHDGNISQFRRAVCVDPATFDAIVEMIRDQAIFHNNSNIPQIPVENQLAIFLFRAGHYGNAATPEAIRHWAGISPGTVVNATNHVAITIHAFHDTAIHLPMLEEKNNAKEWVANHTCLGWRDGYLVVDGTKFPLFKKPGLHGDA